jgi:hypothetical protein
LLNNASQTPPSKKITPGQSLKDLGVFDLVICNFVLVEVKEPIMLDILKNIYLLLEDTGIALITNCFSKSYKRENKWYTFNNDFKENQPTLKINNKLKFAEDQPVTVQVFASFGNTRSFTFSDFFHSGASYRNAYEKANLMLLQTHKPKDEKSDSIEWKAEKEHSPYKIHVVTKQPSLTNTNTQTLKSRL